MYIFDHTGTFMLSAVKLLDRCFVGRFIPSKRIYCRTNRAMGGAWPALFAVASHPCHHCTDRAKVAPEINKHNSSRACPKHIKYVRSKSRRQVSIMHCVLIILKLTPCGGCTPQTFPAFLWGTASPSLPDPPPEEVHEGLRPSNSPPNTEDTEIANPS